MAKRCNYRSDFRLSRKCRRCRHYEACARKVRTHTLKVGALLVLTCVCVTFVGIKICSHEEKPEPIESTWESQTLTSYYPSSEYETMKPNATSEKADKQSETDESLFEESEEIQEETQEKFSESEKIAMGKTVYKEARGECEEGRIAIVAVILNRLATGREEYGAENGDVMEVITYPGAFAYPRDMTDEFFINCPEYEICMEAVERAINGEDPTREYFPEGARHFYSLLEPLSEYEAARREGIYQQVIGNQAFHNEFN